MGVCCFLCMDFRKGQWYPLHERMHSSNMYADEELRTYVSGRMTSFSCRTLSLFHFSCNASPNWFYFSRERYENSSIRFGHPNDKSILLISTPNLSRQLFLLHQPPFGIHTWTHHSSYQILCTRIWNIISQIFRNELLYNFGWISHFFQCASE